MCLPAEQRWVKGEKRGGMRGDRGSLPSGSVHCRVWACKLTGVIGFWASLHFLESSFFLFFLFCLVLIRSCFYIYCSPPPAPPPNTQSFFLTVIHAAHLQCFQERQIKSGFAYCSVTLELQASWITINSIKQHSLCFAPFPSHRPGGLPLSLLNICVYLHNHTHLTNWFLNVLHLLEKKKIVNAHLRNVRPVSWFWMKRRK